MKKFILINIAIFILLIVPTILFRFSYYRCTAGNYGTVNSTVWSSKADTFKKASRLSIEACREKSDRPDKCDVLVCKNYFF
jgi:hypothetical protein